MQNLKTLIVSITLITLFGCTNPADQYEGTWSNQIHGGDLNLVIKRDDEKILFSAVVASTNKQLFIESARINEGYLIIDGDGLFKKIYLC
jgi:hypothetical protein